MTYKDISVATDGSVATILINRPDKLNAMRNQTADELVAAIGILEKDDAVKAVILTGAGRAFGAGYDLSTVDIENDCDLSAVLEDHFNPLVRAIRRSRLLFISAVNGPCAGVSVGIALACDIVLAANSAYFYQPFAQIALVPDGGNTFFYPIIAGRVRAMAAMLLGEKVRAEDARDWGLVWKVHEADQLSEAALEMAKRIGRLSPLAIQRTKQLVNAATEDALEVQLDLERDIQGELGGSPDMVAAVTRFVDGGKGHG